MASLYFLTKSLEDQNPFYYQTCAPSFKRPSQYRRRLRQPEQEHIPEAKKTSYQPSVGVSETEFGYVVEVDLPGVAKEDIVLDLNSNDRVLTLRAERKQKNYAPEGWTDVETDETEQKEEKPQRNLYSYEERSFGSFERVLQLANDVDTESIEAQHKNGVLILMIRKKQPTKKTISIQ
jgi:HSP20 family molecular chaperone IbpA